MMKNIITLLAVTILFFSFTVIHHNNSYQVSDVYSIKIKGTSNIHDWVSTIEEMNNTATISFSEKGDIRIEECKVSIPVKSIKSNKGSIMDKKTWKALNEDNYSTIDYELRSIENVVKTDNNFTADARGDLKIAGTSKSITMKISGKKLVSGDVEISGSKMLKMTDFNIDPPKALMGTLTTGNEITTEFRIVLKSNSSF